MAVVVLFSLLFLLQNGKNARQPTHAVVYYATPCQPSEPQAGMACTHAQQDMQHLTANDDNGTACICTFPTCLDNTQSHECYIRPAALPTSAPTTNPQPSTPPTCFPPLPNRNPHHHKCQLVDLLQILYSLFLPPSTITTITPPPSPTQTQTVTQTCCNRPQNCTQCDMT